MRTRWMAAALMSVVAGFAIAKLPPPSPEQAQAAEAKKEKDKAAVEKEKALLEKAQDRVVQHYKRTKGTMGVSASRGGHAGLTSGRA